MIVDNYGRCGFSQKEIVDHLKINPKFNLNGLLILDAESYEKAKKELCLDVPDISNWKLLENDFSIEEYHNIYQNNWLMPENYKNLDIEKYLNNLTTTEEEKQRVAKEIELYKKFDLLNLLRYLKFLKDVADKYQIILGVGRGSSCASFCLFLLKIHRINSLKFGLEIEEFLHN